MRVNVGYSCDLEDVQEEVSSFLERVSSKLSAASAQAAQAGGLLAGEYEAREVLLRIHEVRVVLSKVDLRLEDISQILAGLEDAKAKVAAGELPEAPPEGLPAGEPAQLEAVSVQEESEVQEEPVPAKGPAPSSKKDRKKKRGR